MPNLDPQSTPGQDWYSGKRKDSRWKKKSFEIMSLHGWQCEECGTAQNLTVHHAHYLRGRDPWDYPEILLMCLCWPCHEERQHLEMCLILDIAIYLRDRRTEDIKKTPAWVFLHEQGGPEIS